MLIPGYRSTVRGICCLRRRSSLRFLASVLTFVSALAMPAFALTSAVDIGALVRESQQMHQDSEGLTLAWWIPSDFWRVTLSQDRSMTFSKDEIDEFVETVNPYIVVAAVKSRMVVTSMKFQDEASVRSNISLIDKSGMRHQPIPPDQLSSDVANLLGVMKPMISGVTGAVGENMHFVVFSGLDADGNQLASATSPGELSIAFFDQTFRWKLPLPSLVEKKTCPVDNEMLSGAWSYCPWHGSKLTSQEP